MGGGTPHDTAGEGGQATMEGIDGFEDRQRVDRWLEESQYLIGRLVPAYLDDRDRVRTRLEVTEHENERLKMELAEARRELNDIRADLEFHRAERATVADTFNAIVDQLAALQRPVNDISRRLHTSQAATAEVKV
jgi:chromosome segregation ATPase